MKTRLFLLMFLTSLASSRPAQARSYIAYISDSSNSSVVYWIAKEVGIFKKHGLDLDTIFIDGSVRGIQSLIAGDLGYTGAVGTAVINAKLAGGDVAIIQSQMNTLPYFVIGNANIKSPEDLRGKTAAVHIPGTSADFALRLALSKIGIPYKDIKAVTLGGAPPRLNATINGQTDFTIVSEGEKLQGEKNGLKVIIDMAKLKVPFQFNCSVATRKKSMRIPTKCAASSGPWRKPATTSKRKKKRRSKSCKSTPEAWTAPCSKAPMRRTMNFSSKTPTPRSKV